MTRFDRPIQCPRCVKNTVVLDAYGQFRCMTAGCSYARPVCVCDHPTHPIHFDDCGYNRQYQEAA